MLQQLGLGRDELAEAWNLLSPGSVEEVHRQFAEAGAGWVIANTFGANRPRLKRHGLDERDQEIVMAAIRSGREAAPALPLLGSLGPTGQHDESAWLQAYERQVELLADAGVDGIVVETIVSLPEGLSAVKAAAASGLPVWAAFTPGFDGAMLDGSSPALAAAMLVHAGAAVIGVNCGCGHESLISSAAQLVAAGVAPVLAAPSLGPPLRGTWPPSYAISPPEFGEGLARLREVGVSLLAGCCGASPAHIAAAAIRLGTPTVTDRTT
jgi:methionine synthase I (cobalamin-dependent)